MKLASYQDGSRDGQLVVVSRDLGSAHYATGIATRLQQVLDDWNFLSPQLDELYASLNHGKPRHAFAFDPRLCAAPLPRAYQRFSSRVGPTGVAMQQAASDDLLGPHDPIALPDAATGLGLRSEPGLAVVTGDLGADRTPDAALESVRLLMLVNDLRRDATEGDDAERWPTCLAAAFGPVAVTPDELGDAWVDGQVHLSLDATRNGQAMGRFAAAADPHHGFGALVAHATRARRLRAGSIVGIRIGGLDASGPALQAGDTLRFDVRGRGDHSVFGSIEQTAELCAAPAACLMSRHT
jgi:fumarylacetoacetate (FAA) hydrolase